MRALWTRWAVRDLRARWVQVTTTALILAIGIAAFWGVGGLRMWRERSTDASLAAMRAHDLRLDLPEGSFVPEGRLRAVASRAPDGTVAVAEERLVAPSQLDASRPGHPVLLPARVIGIPGRPGAQRVDRLEVLEGRPGAAILDWNFANRSHLPPSGRVRLAGAGPVAYSGHGVTPQHLLIVDESGMAGAESKLGTIYLPLAAAQRVVGRPGAVNELVLRVPHDTDVGTAERTLRAAFRDALPGSPVTLTRGDEETAQRILYRDARNDQKVFLTLAILVLAGAAVAAFNLISRVVEAQRREIGIGMALGVEPRLLALRPLALAAQIALLGVLLSVPIGLGLSGLIKELLKDYFPLPVYARTFPTGLFVLASGVGVAIPLLAAAIPVRRAVRVAPIEAIRIGFRAAKGAGASRLLSGLPIPGRSLARLPVRNVARAPLRTLLTVLALAGVITSIVAVLGMVDAIRDVADRQEGEVLRSSPSRLNVQLSGLEAAAGPLVRRLSTAPGVARSEPSLTVAAELRRGEKSIDAALTFVPLDSRVWSPSVAGGGSGRPGILLSRRAADTMGAAPGDRIVLRHPRRAGRGLAMTSTPVRVAGIHGSPLRVLAYMDAAGAGRLGLGGLANGLTLVPEPGRATALEHALFGQPGVASVRPASSDTEALRTTVSAFTETIQIVALITLGLGLLVAFTTVSVSVDERRREYATMFAFGFPPRAGLRVTMVESLITGLLGTAAGIGIGLVVATWIVDTLVADTFPDLGAEMALTAGSVLLALVVGLLATGLAPMFTFRRMRGMDIPSTLRVVE